MITPPTPREPGPVLLVRTRTCVAALPLPSVVETLRPLPTEPVAGMPAFVRGVAVVRGGPTPVIDLAALLSGGAFAPDPEVARFVTLRVGERRVALAVAAVLGVGGLDESTLHSLPPLLGAACGEFVEALGAHDAQLLLVLRAARLLPEEVWRALAQPELTR